MTAPRHSARKSPRPVGPPRPSSITILSAALLSGLALPIGALYLAAWIDRGPVLLASIFGMVFLFLAAFLWAARRRVGSMMLRGSTALPAAVGAGLITAAYAGITVLWGDSQGPEADFVAIDVLLPLGAMAAAATFIVIYSTLSMARSADRR